ncbi:HdeD family acid-resistance protein [Pelagerythrobacter rhizovicinus]|uniref:HdeD family acid-resistance protein n=1 Tax=Pelagerythrobacter rhizovicinus TaxID=2268576 RepID=A0A4Q2KSU0_9SPHN|nr:DUF308 domain-containing protein [Pelagerythrobacter rhizovicinus]RXZ66733.1 HdeD family acid-resistance protein [Pelagerythrobacter rhizovicinus]
MSRHDPLDHLPARNWGWFALRGVLLLVLGGLSLAFPAAALFTFALVFAVYCFIDGIFALASGIRGARRKEERWWALILAGLLGIAVGVIFVLFPGLGTLAYALTAIAVIAGWAVATGVLQIAAAWRLRRAIEGEWLLIASGALTVLLGIGLIALLMVAPEPTLMSVAWMIGIWALIAGMALLVLAFRLRRHGGERVVGAANGDRGV